MAPLSSIVGSDAEVLRERPFQLLLLANVLPALGTALLSPVLGSLVDPLGTTTANVGLLMSAFTGPAVVVIPVAGVIADRLGRRPVILFGLLWFGAAGSAIALTTDFRVALGLRMLQGVGFAALTPIIITSIGDLYTGTKEATAQGLRFTGTGVAQTAFPLAAGALVVLAWQYPFLLYAVAFPIAAVVYLWFEEPVDPEADADDDGRDVRTQLRELWALVSQRRAWAMVVARGTPMFVWLGFLTYNSIVVVDLVGGTPVQAGVLAALSSLSFALAASQAGRITERFDSRLWPLVAMNVAMAVGLSLVFVAGTLVAAFVGAVTMGTGFGVVLSLYRSVITNMADPARRGGLVSVGEGVGRLSATLAPILMGGAIALAAPRLGFASAVRSVGVATSVLAAAAGIGCLFLVHRAPPVRADA
ncbi:MFS transporter [Halorarum salinum]|uniref:MFS transporter n=1 Tax=Halorarum salinum TaxID=2743089 RepID=A0A7D5LCL8_9EURY|nr:MFS transporter [Halobaculum salinum]QLG63653.1 MFS transporter [Halobaculum salinum]